MQTRNNMDHKLFYVLWRLALYLNDIFFRYVMNTRSKQTSYRRPKKTIVKNIRTYSHWGFRMTFRYVQQRVCSQHRSLSATRIQYSARQLGWVISCQQPVNRLGLMCQLQHTSAKLKRIYLWRHGHWRYGHWRDSNNDCNRWQWCNATSFRITGWYVRRTGSRRYISNDSGLQSIMEPKFRCPNFTRFVNSLVTPIRRGNKWSERKWEDNRCKFPRV